MFTGNRKRSRLNWLTEDFATIARVKVRVQNYKRREVERRNVEEELLQLLSTSIRNEVKVATLL